MQQVFDSWNFAGCSVKSGIDFFAEVCYNYRQTKTACIPIRGGKYIAGMIDMKKTILITTALTLAALMLFGCTDAPSDSSSHSLTESLASSPTQSDEEEVPALLRTAFEAYAWFEICSLPTVDITVGDDGALRKVADNRFELYDDFVAYMRGIFSEDIVKSLFNEDSENPPYHNIDGYTYCMDFARGTDASVLKAVFDGGVESGDTLTYTATVSYGEPGSDVVTETKEFRFVAVKTDSGYVFTEFPYFY